MGHFIIKNFLIIGILLLGPAAMLFPRPGILLRQSGTMEMLIFTIFVCSGLKLTVLSLLEQIRKLHVLFVSLFSLNIVFPCLAFLLAKCFGFSDQAYIGMMIISTVPPTLATGIILVEIGRGSRPLAILITLLGNVSAVLILPFTLGFLISLDQPLSWDRTAVILKMVKFMILPIGAGMALRKLFGKQLTPYGKVIDFIPNLCMVLFLYIAVSVSQVHFVKGLSRIPLYLLYSVILHLTMLYANNLIARGLKLDSNSCFAFYICTTQKALSVAMLVWLSCFSAGENFFPLALLPCFIYYLVQLFVDAFIAQRRTVLS
jgi:predicted Na+-dependent transporter